MNLFAWISSRGSPNRESRPPSVAQWIMLKPRQSWHASTVVPRRARRLLYHSTLGLRVIKKRGRIADRGSALACSLTWRVLSTSPRFTCGRGGCRESERERRREREGEGEGGREREVGRERGGERGRLREGGEEIEGKTERESVRARDRETERESGRREWQWER